MALNTSLFRIISNCIRDNKLPASSLFEARVYVYRRLLVRL